MTMVKKCDLCGNEVLNLVGQMAIGTLEGKPPVLDICPDCKKKIMDTFGLTEPVVEEPSAPAEAKE